MEKIWLSPPHIGEKEFEYVREAFETNWIAPLGPHVDGFEKDLQQRTGANHVAVLSSGTAAIHLALIILGIKRGDEVICQSMTFAASANPILYQQATPIFIDSETDTWNMDPYLLEKAIKDRILLGRKPKAIIPVHLYGMPAQMQSIMQIADAYQIPVIEDAAEALGSSINGQGVGTFGRCAVLSFNGNKIITTSGGGALISNEKEIIKKAKFLATQARDNAPHYQHSQVGYNYRLSNILAAIGRGQLEVLDEHIRQRRKNFDVYKNELGTLPGINFLDEPENYFCNRWLSTILIDPEKSGGITHEDVRLALEEDNIESRPLWKPMHLQPVFADYPYYGNGVAEDLFNNGLCLPSGSNLTSGQQYRVIEKIKSLFHSSNKAWYHFSFKEEPIAVPS